MAVITKKELREDIKTFLKLLGKRIAVIFNTAFLFYIMTDIFNIISTKGNLSFQDFFTNPEKGKYWLLTIVFSVLSGYFHPERFKSIDWFWIFIFWVLTLTGFCIVY